MVFIALAVLLVAMFAGVAVPFAFTLCIVILMVAGGYDPAFLVPYGITKVATSTLLSIPLFIMAGALMSRGKIGDQIVGLVDVLFGHVRGGLAVVATCACSLFGSVTGSACATLSCIGSIMFPRMDAANYPKGPMAALMASNSVLGMLIPPSGVMILFCWVGGQSVLAAFLAGVIPGLMLTFLFSTIMLFILRKYKDIKTFPEPPRAEKIALFKKRGKASVPALLMPVIILGGIYGGIMTTTEAAAVAVLYSIPVGFFVYKGLTRRDYWEAMVESATTTGVIMVMAFAMMMLARLFIMENLPGQILKLLTSVSSNKNAILFMVNIFMIIIGMLMDDCSGTLLCTPILLPVVMAVGVDPIHFAAILGVNLGLGCVTPPAAPLLYLSARLHNASIKDMLMPTLWLIIFGWIPVLIITTYIPDVALFLPKLILDYVPRMR